MDIDDFEDHVDRWGEDVSAWPEPSRTRAQALLRDSAEAREILAEAVALRQALAARSVDRAPAGLADRIVAAALAGDGPAPVGPTTPATATPSRPGWMSVLERLLAPAWRPAVVLSACFLLGLASSFLITDRSIAYTHASLPGSVFQDFR